MFVIALNCINKISMMVKFKKVDSLKGMTVFMRYRIVRRLLYLRG